MALALHQAGHVSPEIDRLSALFPQFIHNMVKLWIDFYKGSPMTMHVNLSSEMEGYIKSKVASGFYGNATEVIRDASRRMSAEEARAAAWQAAIAKGDAQLDRGEGAVYTPELMERITQSAVANMRTAETMDPDVLP